MFVVYNPADGDPERWEFHADQVMDVDAEAIEKAFTDTWDAFLMAVLKGGMRARRVLLWHLIKTTHPSLRFADLSSFRVGELKVEWDRDELAQMRSSLADEKKSQGVDASTREVMLAYLDREIEQAPESGEPGKARSKPSGSATRSRSATG